MRQFLVDLTEHGRVRVPTLRERPLAQSREVEPGVRERLRSLDDIDRADAPGDSPPLDETAAVWAARVLFRSCQLLVDREVVIDAALRDEVLADPPDRERPAAIVSVDLTLRYLPDLFALAAGLAADDPLLGLLRELAVAWPLSSVGVALADPPPLAACVLRDPGVRIRYVDRILRRQDRLRLADPATRRAVRDALGAHPALAGGLAPRLDDPEDGAAG